MEVETTYPVTLAAWCSDGTGPDAKRYAMDFCGHTVADVKAEALAWIAEREATAEEFHFGGFAMHRSGRIE